MGKMNKASKNEMNEGEKLFSKNNMTKMEIIAIVKDTPNADLLQKRVSPENKAHSCFLTKDAVSLRITVGNPQLVGIRRI